MHSLRMHISRVHLFDASKKDFQCSQCEYKTSRKRLLEVHMFTHTTERTVKCGECDYLAKSAHHLRKHHDQVHKGIRYQMKPKECTICGKMTLRMAQHMRTAHSDERNFLCPFCGKGFKDKAILTQHTKVIHSEERPFACHICQKTFKMSQSLKKHMKTHEGPPKIRGRKKKVDKENDEGIPS